MSEAILVRTLTKSERAAIARYLDREARARIARETQQRYEARQWTIQRKADADAARAEQAARAA